MNHQTTESPSWAMRLAEWSMALCLGVMALAVFINVILRYGFGSGIQTSEELARLLFVWMVFIGAAVAYPRGEHMAVTTFLQPLTKPGRETAMRWMTRLVHSLTLLACCLLAWGAWQQVIVGMGSVSVVMGYPQALLPLPAFLCAVFIAGCSFLNLLRTQSVMPTHTSEVE